MKVGDIIRFRKGGIRRIITGWQGILNRREFAALKDYLKGRHKIIRFSLANQNKVVLYAKGDVRLAIGSENFYVSRHLVYVPQRKTNCRCCWKHCKSQTDKS